MKKVKNMRRIRLNAEEADFMLAECLWMFFITTSLQKAFIMK